MSNKYKILEMLKDNEYIVKEIAENSEFNENQVRVYVHRLLNDGLVKRIKSFTKLRREKGRSGTPKITLVRPLLSGGLSMD